MCKYSIIVPIYNVSKYIQTCLLSIENQTYKDFECILVDDGSTDDSGQQALVFAQRDNRFKYFLKENGGLSDARNFGLNQANGEFIIFIDSDDVISEQFIQYVDIAFEQHDVDIVIVDMMRFHEDSELAYHKVQSVKMEMLSQKEALNEANYSWARITHKGKYQNNFFPVGLIYEDLVVSPLLLSKAQNVIKINSPLYFYRRRQDSITTQSLEKQFELAKSLQELKKRCDEGKVDFCYYLTPTINMVQSIVLVSLRFPSYRESLFRLTQGAKIYQNISVAQILSSYSSLQFKILTVLLKSAIGRMSLLILKPIIQYMDNSSKKVR